MARLIDVATSSSTHAAGAKVDWTGTGNTQERMRRGARLTRLQYIQFKSNGTSTHVTKTPILNDVTVAYKR